MNSIIEIFYCILFYFSAKIFPQKYCNIILFIIIFETIKKGILVLRTDDIFKNTFIQPTNVNTNINKIIIIYMFFYFLGNKLNYFHL